MAFSLGQPGLGPRRIAAQLARPEWARLSVSHNAVWKVLRRHGLSTLRARLGLVAGYRAPYQPPAEPAPEPHIEVERPGELVGIDCFKVGRLHGTQGEVWQLTAIDVRSSFAWAELVACKRGMPSAEQTSRLARRGRRRAGRRRLAPRARAQRQRLGIQGRLLPHTRTARHTPEPDQGRPAPNQRPRRGAPQDDPRRVLAALLRTLPDAAPGRAAPRARRILEARPHRPPHPSSGPRRPRLRCPQDGAEMSRHCRHIPEAVHTSRQVRLRSEATR